MSTNPRPANSRRSSNAALMLAQRRRRWANIKPAIAERLVFAGRPATYRNSYENTG